MTTPRLGPTAFVVLGMVGLRGPTTPYELQRAVERTVGHFWRFPRSQFYDEPARLAAAGLLVEKRESVGRRRRTYTITDGGREALRQWLSEPAEKPMEIRDVAQLKLFFAELGEPAVDVPRLAAEQERLNRERLEEFEEIAEATRERRREFPHRVAPLDLGLRIVEDAAEFWARVAKPRRR